MPIVLIPIFLGFGIVWLFISRPVTPVLPQPPLKDLAGARGIQLGNFASLKRLGDKPFTDILTSQYNFVLLDGEPNWTFNDGKLGIQCKRVS